MNTRLDGPGIAGKARAKYPTGQGVWKVTPDATHPPRPTPETGEATDILNRSRLLAISIRNQINLHSAVQVAKDAIEECVSHGENRVCARLPRLWGMWKKSGEWVKYTDGTPVLVLSDGHARYGEVEGEQWPREYDPRTGGPKA